MLPRDNAVHWTESNFCMMNWRQALQCNKIRRGITSKTAVKGWMEKRGAAKRDWLILAPLMLRTLKNIHWRCGTVTLLRSCRKRSETNNSEYICSRMVMLSVPWIQVSGGSKSFSLYFKSMVGKQCSDVLCSAIKGLTEQGSSFRPLKSSEFMFVHAELLGLPKQEIIWMGFSKADRTYLTPFHNIKEVKNTHFLKLNLDPPINLRRKHNSSPMQGSCKGQSLLSKGCRTKDLSSYAGPRDEK